MIAVSDRLKYYSIPESEGTRLTLIQRKEENQRDDNNQGAFLHICTSTIATWLNPDTGVMTYSLPSEQRAFSSFPALPQINPRYEEERGNSQREALARLIISEILIREASFSELR